MPASLSSSRRSAVALLLPIALASHLFGCSQARRHEPKPSAARVGAPDAATSPSPAPTSAPAPARLDDCPTAEACEARQEGRARVDSGDWRSAIPFLEAATRDHPQDGVLFLLLARAGAQALGEERCAYDVSSVAGIRAALEKAFSLGVPMKVAATDPSFDILRMSLWFQFEVLGRDPKDPQALRRALEESNRLVAVGTAQGAFGAQAGVDFEESGRAVVWRVDSARIPPRLKAPARWSVSQDATVTVEIDDTPPWGESQRRFEGRVDPDGFLELPGLGRIGDDDFECSA